MSNRSTLYSPTIVIAAFFLLLSSFLCGKSSELCAQGAFLGPHTKGKKMKDFDISQVDPKDPVPECRRAIQEFGYFREALDILRPWTLNPEVKNASLPQGVELALNAMGRLNLQEQIDAYLEECIAAHPDNWRLLAQCAHYYQYCMHLGTMIDGTFSRGNLSGRHLSSERRDRIRALQLYRDAEKEIQKETDPASAKEIAQFYRNFAQQFDSPQFWRLQILTDLETLPEYDEGDQIDHSMTKAPVDEEGNPLFFCIPESFDQARNDGERFRYLLERAAKTDTTQRTDIELQLARWLDRLYGVQTLRSYQSFFDRALDSDEVAKGQWALNTLTDDETIAYLASGVKRFTLPEEQNSLRIYKEIYETGNDPSRLAAGTALVEAYCARRQFETAAQWCEKLIPLEVHLNYKPITEKYAQIIGNWGEFGLIEPKCAGEETTLLWKYRNARRVSFKAYEVKTDLLLADIEETMKGEAKKLVNLDSKQAIRMLQFSPESVGWRLMNEPETKQKYLGEMVAQWDNELHPAPGHETRVEEIPFPITRGGVYLIQGTTQDGNSDAICLWIQQLSLVQKNLEGKQLWYVTDARTGDPIPNATLHFFGYEDTGRRLKKLKFHESTGLTDQNGLFIHQLPEAEDAIEWIVTATDPEQKYPKACFGLRYYWSRELEEDDFEEDSRAFFTTDRPIYRPGDDAHFKIWVGLSQYQQPTQWPWANKTVYYEIDDPSGTTVQEGNVTLDSSGGYEGEFKTTSSMKLGVYSIEIKTSREGDDLGDGVFRLEEYKKPEYEVTVDLPKDPIQLGQPFQAKISARYYFGAPVTKGTVHYTVTRVKRTEQWFPIRSWDWLYGNGYGWLAPNFSWYPGWKKWGIYRPFPLWTPYWGECVPEVVAQGTTEIGEDGTVEVAVDTAFAQELYPGEDQTYKIEAEVTDLSRRTITGRGEIIAANRAFSTYCWTKTGFIEPNQQVETSILARRADGKPVTGQATVTLYRLEYEGAPDPKTGLIEPKESSVGNKTLDLNSEGEATWRFMAGDVGQYRIAVQVVSENGLTDEGGTLFDVRGTGKADPKAFHSEPLSLVLEKPEYQPGETVRLSVGSSTPTGTVLLFLRSQDQTSGQPIPLKLDGTRQYYEFPLEEKDAPNIFVEALMVKNGRYYEETREIPVVPEKRVIDVAVTPEKSLCKPGEETSLTLSLTDIHQQPIEGEVVVAVYDRAVEAISGGSAIPEIKEFFWNWKRYFSPDHQDNLERATGPILWDGKKIMQSLSLFEDRFYGGEVMMGAMPGRMTRGMGGAMPNAISMNAMTNGMEMMLESAPIMSKSAMAPAAAPLAMGVAEDEMMDAAAFAPAQEPMAQEPMAQEPTIRENFSDTALWVGRLPVDSQGTVTVPLTLPESLTSWKIRVWSMAPGTRVGEGTAEILTSKDLLIRMERPRFLTQSDQAVFSAIVHNQLETDQDVTVSLSVDPEGNEGIVSFDADSAVQKIHLAAGEQKRIDWTLHALGTGDLKLIMKALAAGDSDAVAETFPIQVHGVYKLDAFSGIIRGEKSSDQCCVKVPEKRREEETLLTVRVSPTLAASLIDALPYLAQYPYGCTEQTLNRFLPALIVRQTLDQIGMDLESIQKEHTNLNTQQLDDGTERLKKRFDENPLYDSEKLDEMVARGVEKLEEMQCSDGGWGWFSGFGERSTPYLTALVTRGLITAQNQGADLNANTVEQGLNWLVQYQKEETQKIFNAETWTEDQKQANPRQWKKRADSLDALIYYVLSMRMRNSEPRMQDYLLRDRLELPLYSALLYALALNREDDKLNYRAVSMIERMARQYLVIDSENQTAYLDIGRAPCWGGFWRWWSWDGNLIETQTAYLRLLVQTDPNALATEQLAKYLLNNRKNGSYWNGTRDTALCIEALCDYLKATQEAEGPCSVDILVDGEVRGKCQFTPETLFTANNTIEITDLTAGEHQVEIRRTDGKKVYWNAYLRNFTLEDFITAAGMELKIDRRYWLLTEETNAQADVAGGRGQALRQRIRRWKRSPIELGTEVKSGDRIEVELIVESKNDYDSLLIEDFKPAGFEPVDLTSGYTGNSLGAYVEYRDNRTCFFIPYLNRGKGSVTYQLRAEVPGKFSALPASILGMYAPELKGNSDEMKFLVNDQEEGTEE